VETYGFGERFESVRPFLQKFSQLPPVRYNMAPGTGGYSLQNSIPFFFPPPCNIGLVYMNYYQGGVGIYYSSSVPWTWFGHYSALFNGVRGSMRLKGQITSTPVVVQNGGMTGGFAPQAVASTFRVSASQHVGAPANTVSVLNYGDGVGRAIGGSMGGTFTTGSGAKDGFEFIFPYYDRLKFYDPMSLQRSACVDGKWIDVAVTNAYVSSVAMGTTTEVALTYWVAGGSDISVVRFRCAPAIIVAGPPQPLMSEDGEFEMSMDELDQGGVPNITQPEFYGARNDPMGPLEEATSSRNADNQLL